MHQAATCPWMIQSGWWRLLVLDPPRMMQFWASVLISPYVAVFLFWPLLLVLPQMIQSTALHGLLTASLHPHGLVRSQNHCFTTGSCSLLLHCLTTPSSSWLLLRLSSPSSSCMHHCITTAFPCTVCPRVTRGALGGFSPQPCPHHCFPASPRPLPNHRFSTSPRPHPLISLSASPRLVHLNAALHLLGLVFITVSLHLHGVVLCAAAGNDSIAAPPRPRPHVCFASWRHFPSDGPVRGVGAPLAWSAPDDPACGFRPDFPG